jgi:uncharacterized protein YjbJ (UPF0337 family)
MNNSQNNNQFKKDWEQVRGQAQERWDKLTDRDIHEIDGSQKKLIGKLTAYYGYSSEDADQELNAFMENCGCGSDSVSNCSTSAEVASKSMKNEGSPQRNSSQPKTSTQPSRPS